MEDLLCWHLRRNVKIVRVREAAKLFCIKFLEFVLHLSFVTCSPAFIERGKLLLMQLEVFFSKWR